MINRRWRALFSVVLMSCGCLSTQQAQAAEDNALVARRLLGPLVLVKPLSPHTLARLTDEAESLYRFGLHRQSLEAFEAVTELVPGHAPSWLRVGNIQQRLGRRDRAIAAYRKAVASSATASDAVRRKALFNLGVIHMDEIDKIIEALEALAKQVGEAASHDVSDPAGQHKGSAGQQPEATQALASLRAAREDAAEATAVLHARGGRVWKQGIRRPGFNDDTMMDAQRRGAVKTLRAPFPMRARFPMGRRSNGAVTVEWLLAAPIVLLLGLGALQWSLVFQARSALAFALQQAAREGAIDHALPTAIERGLARGLIPYWGLAGPGLSLDLVLPSAQARLALESSQGVLVWRQISPSREAFSDWAQQGRDGEGQAVPGQLEIPNDGLAHADQRVGALSGQSLRDANLLKLDMRYGVPLRVPMIGPLAVRIMEVLDGCTSGAAASPAAASPAPWTCTYYRAPGPSGQAVGRWPVQLVATTRMQSAAWPSGQTPLLKTHPAGSASGPAGGHAGENPSGPAGGHAGENPSGPVGAGPPPVPGPPSSQSQGSASSQARQLSEAILARGPATGAACTP